MLLYVDCNLCRPYCPDKIQRAIGVNLKDFFLSASVSPHSHPEHFSCKYSFIENWVVNISYKPHYSGMT